jgi:hypothetical protein
MLIIPIFTEGRFWGVLSIDDCRNERKFSAVEEQILNSVGILLVTAILRNEMTKSIIDAKEQALDYRTSPRAGIVIAPDEGYHFVGWSHDSYFSLRGELIPAQSGIMRYDTLTIYGNVNLHANFALDNAPPQDHMEKETTPAPPVEGNGGNLWSVKDELFVRVTTPGSILRIYSIDGVLQQQHTILQPGETKYKLPSALYIVTLNNSLGTKILIN